MKEAPNYCRRIKTTPQGKESPCGQRITRRNALGWCQDCRSRLPLWPPDEAGGVELTLPGIP